jgi:hypothetical protein
VVLIKNRPRTTFEDSCASSIATWLTLTLA